VNKELVAGYALNPSDGSGGGKGEEKMFSEPVRPLYLLLFFHPR
jgi:hypothetical protein